VSARVRAAAVGLALALLLALVAVAAGARGGGGLGSSSPQALPRAIFDYAFTLGILFAIGGLIALLFLRPQQGPREEQRGGLLRLVAAMAAFMFLAYVALGRGALSEEAREALQRLAERAPAAEGSGDGGEAAPVDPLRIRWELVGLVAAVALATAAAGVRRRLRRRPRREAATLEEELAEALGEGLDDLRAEPDARRAVVAAYARMERALGAHGLARRPAETALEYLGRALRDLRVPAEAVLDLTGLFERAKFSPHPIDGAMKEEAIAALETVRAALLAPDLQAAA